MAQAMEEEHTQWMSVIEQAAVHAKRNAVDELHSTTIRRMPGAARQLAENEGINALLPHNVSGNSGSTSSGSSGSGAAAGTAAPAAEAQAEVDVSARTMEAHLLNALFTSDLTAGLVGWQPHPADRLAEIATESPLLHALTQHGMQQARGPTEPGSGLARAGSDAALQRYHALLRPPAQKLGIEVLPEPADARPGMHIKYSFFNGGAEHHGVVVSDGRVVEVVNRMFSNYDNNGQSVRSLVTTSTTEEFWQRARKNGSEVFRVLYALEPSPDEVAERARMSLGRWNYHAVFNICEHVATWIVTGAYMSEQCDHFMQARGPRAPGATSASGSARSDSAGTSTAAAKRLHPQASAG
jgi:hypothetical protein